MSGCWAARVILAVNGGLLMTLAIRSDVVPQTWLRIALGVAAGLQCIAAAVLNRSGGFR